MKVAFSQHATRTGDLVMEIMGADGMLWGDVHGHEKVRTYGHERSALVATKSPQFWPPKVRTPH